MTISLRSLESIQVYDSEGGVSGLQLREVGPAERLVFGLTLAEFSALERRLARWRVTDPLGPVSE